MKKSDKIARAIERDANSTIEEAEFIIEEADLEIIEASGPYSHLSDPVPYERRSFRWWSILTPGWWIRVMVWLLLNLTLIPIFFIVYCFIEGPKKAPRHTWWLIVFAIKASPEQYAEFLRLTGPARQLLINKFRRR